MAKTAKETSFLVSSGNSGYFYSNRKNKRKSKGEAKLSLKKYDPKLRKHVLFQEKKLTKVSTKAPAKPAAPAPEAQ